MNISTPGLLRWGGIAAVVAGVSYALVGLSHPPNEVAAVTTAPWLIVHLLAMATSIFGLFGLAALQARQADKSGGMGLAGYLLLSLWLMLILGFAFVEVLVLPALATVSPAFVEGWMGMFNGAAAGPELEALSAVWTLTAPLYILGGLLFGVATFRAGVLERWAGLLLAFGVLCGPLAALLPLDLQPKVAIPVGLALTWMGYSLWSDRQARAPAGSPAPAASAT